MSYEDPRHQFNALSRSLSNIYSTQFANERHAIPDGWSVTFRAGSLRFLDPRGNLAEQDPRGPLNYLIRARNQTSASQDDRRLQAVERTIGNLPIGWTCKINTLQRLVFLHESNNIESYGDPRSAQSFKQKVAIMHSRPDMQMSRGYHEIFVDRKYFMDHAFQQLMGAPILDFRKKLFVCYKGEAGTDIGGLTRYVEVF